jgi:hypothetical protein
MQRTLDQVESELINEIEKCRYIIDGLDNNESYKRLVADFQLASDEIDSVWHLEQDLNRLTEMRITKLATQSLVNALDGYKQALERAKEQLEKLKDQDA